MRNIKEYNSFIKENLSIDNITNIKMYYFKPNDYDAEYIVMAENKTKAYEYLMKKLKNDVDNNISFTKEKLNKWVNVNPLDNKTFPDKYTLEEHELGSVIETYVD